MYLDNTIWSIMMVTRKASIQASKDVQMCKESKFEIINEYEGGWGCGGCTKLGKFMKSSLKGILNTKYKILTEYHAMACNVPINGPILQKKAAVLAEKLGHNDFR